MCNMWQSDGIRCISQSLSWLRHVCYGFLISNCVRSVRFYINKTGLDYLTNIVSTTSQSKLLLESEGKQFIYLDRQDLSHMTYVVGRELHNQRA